MNRSELEKLSKSQLIELMLSKNEKEKSEKSIIIHRPMPSPITKKPVIITKEKKKQEKKEKLPTYEELNQLSFNELRKMAKSIRGIGKYGYLNKAQLIDQIIKTKKPKTKTQPKPKPQIQPKPKKENTYEELNQLSFNELRKMAKSIRGIGKYGDLNKAQLIDKIIKTKKPKTKTQQKLNQNLNHKFNLNQKKRTHMRNLIN